jgi:hypothetical protein
MLPVSLVYIAALAIPLPVGKAEYNANFGGSSFRAFTMRTSPGR